MDGKTNTRRSGTWMQRQGWGTLISSSTQPHSQSMRLNQSRANLDPAANARLTLPACLM